MNCRFSKLWRAFVCKGLLSLNALGPRATSGARPTVISSRDSLAALNAMTTVQVLRPYSVSGADGKRRYSGIVKEKTGGKGAAGTSMRNVTPCARGSGARPAACRLQVEEDYENSLNLFDIFRFLLSMPKAVAAFFACPLFNGSGKLRKCSGSFLRLENPRP